MGTDGSYEQSRAISRDIGKLLPHLWEDEQELEGKEPGKEGQTGDLLKEERGEGGEDGVPHVWHICESLVLGHHWCWVVVS